MNIEDAGRLLQVQAYQDGRHPSDGQIMVWADSLDGIEYDVALDAMRSLWKDSTEYMTPALIRARVVQRRRKSETDERRVRAEIEAGKIRLCGLCDERGYRLPARTVLCRHREVRTIGAAAQVRAMLEAGGSDQEAVESTPSVAVGERSDRAGLSVPEVTKSWA